MVAPLLWVLGQYKVSILDSIALFGAMVVLAAIPSVSVALVVIWFCHNHEYSLIVNFLTGFLLIRP